MGISHRLLSQARQTRRVRTESQLKTPPPLPTLFYFPACEWCRGTGNGAAVYSALSLLLLRGFSLLLLHMESLHPSQADPMWPSHRLQLSKHCPTEQPALYNRAHPSDPAPHGSPSAAAPPPQASPHRLQLQSAAASAGASSTAAPWAPPRLHVEICSVWNL